MIHQDVTTVRKYSRFPIHTTMMYLGKNSAGQGILRELSRVGCRILGNYPVTAGDVLSLRITSPIQPTPVCITNARVMWVKGLEFGLAFGVLDDGAVYDLQQLLGELLDWERASECAVGVAH
jgi:PilZ domain